MTDHNFCFLSPLPGLRWLLAAVVGRCHGSPRRRLLLHTSGCQAVAVVRDSLQKSAISCRDRDTPAISHSVSDTCISSVSTLSPPLTVFYTGTQEFTSHNELIASQGLMGFCLHFHRNLFLLWIICYTTDFVTQKLHQYRLLDPNGFSL